MREAVLFLKVANFQLINIDKKTGIFDELNSSRVWADHFGANAIFITTIFRRTIHVFECIRIVSIKSGLAGIKTFFQVDPIVRWHRSGHL
jgi:hypothetical protein